jgi:phospholipase/carboxylesterase
MHASLRVGRKLAGLMSLSSWLPLGERFADEVANNPNSQARDLPVFMAHGSFDPVLPISLGQQSRVALQGAGYDIEWHEYPMAHAVCAEEIRDIRNWLLTVFEPAKP